MHFVDECLLTVEAGDGGDGAIAFRREKFMPFGGPSGGDGGRGGHVYFEVDEGLGSLLDLKHQRTLRAGRGQHGQGKDKYGAGGKDVTIGVPPGTLIYDADSGALLHDLKRRDEPIIVARGGRGGRGNIHFATPTERAPRRAEPGAAGEKLNLRLELKVMADVGLLGFPNVGKSTFIRAVSRARPKVADYPFTTLEPHLGVVAIGNARAGLGRSFVIADIPGLIPGASEGVGLGNRFLKHVERTRVLLHMITLSEDPERDPMDDYVKLREELRRHSRQLAQRVEIVALTKADLPEVRELYPDLAKQFAALGIDLQLISSATHSGLDELLERLARLLDSKAKSQAAETESDEIKPDGDE